MVMQPGPLPRDEGKFVITGHTIHVHLRLDGLHEDRGQFNAINRTGSGGYENVCIDTLMINVRKGRVMQISARGFKVLKDGSVGAARRAMMLSWRDIPDRLQGRVREAYTNEIREHLPLYMES